MATFHPRSVCASQENVVGGASDKKEVQEQACYGLCGFLPMLTAQRKKSHASRWGKQRGPPSRQPSASAVIRSVRNVQIQGRIPMNKCKRPHLMEPHGSEVTKLVVCKNIMFIHIFYSVVTFFLKSGKYSHLFE